MKLAVIGAGSTYTPELVSGLSRERERVPLDELVLHDIDASAARSWAAWRSGCSTGRATRRADAHRRARPRADGADFVLIQIRVGGQEARLRDETIPVACGCIGRRRPARAGSPRRSARCRSCSTSPERARDARPDGAWIVDFTNPVGIVTRALLDQGHRAIGRATSRSASSARSRARWASSPSAC
jgi:6-phospho-beta-glucosidase